MTIDTDGLVMFNAYRYSTVPENNGEGETMAKIINFRYTNSLDNKGIILTGTLDGFDLFETEESALESAQLLIDENPDGSDVYCLGGLRKQMARWLVTWDFWAL